MLDWEVVSYYLRPKKADFGNIVIKLLENIYDLYIVGLLFQCIMHSVIQHVCNVMYVCSKHLSICSAFYASKIRTNLREVIYAFIGLTLPSFHGYVFETLRMRFLHHTQLVAKIVTAKTTSVPIQYAYVHTDNIRWKKEVLHVYIHRYVH